MRRGVLAGLLVGGLLSGCADKGVSPSDLDALRAEISSLQDQVTVLEQALDEKLDATDLDGYVTRAELSSVALSGSYEDLIARPLAVAESVLSLGEYLTVDTESHLVQITGANVQLRDCPVVDGFGCDGYGNLIIGHNEAREDDPLTVDIDESTREEDRSGSHNLVIGPGHHYNWHYNVISGDRNTALGSYGALLGGQLNEVGIGSVVVGGSGNTAESGGNTITGGSGNTVSGVHSSISGGKDRTLDRMDGWQAGELIQDDD